MKSKNNLNKLELWTIKLSQSLPGIILILFVLMLLCLVLTGVIAKVFLPV